MVFSSRAHLLDREKFSFGNWMDGERMAKVICVFRFDDFHGSSAN